MASAREKRPATTRRAYGSGSIREVRPGYWQLRVMVPDPVGKGSRQATKGFRGTKKDAQRALAEFSTRASTGRHISTEGTVAHLVERWLAQVAPRLADNTVTRYRIAAEQWILPVLGDHQLRTLTTEDLDRLYTRMERSGSASASIRKVHSVMSRALDQARRWKWVAENVAADASPPPVRGREITPPTVAQVELLLAEAARYSPDPAFGVFLRLAATTGARRGELCGLRWADIDLPAATMLIAHSVTASGALKGTKSGKERRVALDAGTITLLESYRAHVAERAAGMGVPWGAESFLFSADPSGARPWVATSPTTAFAKVRERVGLEGVRLHDLRHWSVTQQLSAGTPVLVVAGRHGHAGGGRTTQAIYAKFIPGTDRGAADLMGALLAPGRDEGGQGTSPKLTPAPHSPVSAEHGNPTAR